MVKKSSFDKEKFKQVLHCIISKVAGLDNVGKTVLYKILYFSDFDYYELNEESITGEKYVKLPLGPAPSNFNVVVKELIKEKKIKEVKTKYRGMVQTKFISLCEPKLTRLTAEEMKIINSIIQRLSNMTARQVSAYSHGDLPWKATEKGKEIDYELVFYRKPTYSVTQGISH